MGIEFSRQTREHIEAAQDGCCLNCGDKGRLSLHHMIPKCMGGDGREENAVGLCRGKGTNNCHTKADELTINHGIPFETIAREGIAPLMDALPRRGVIFERKYKRTLRDHRRKNRR